jgi:hypothetical protein
MAESALAMQLKLDSRCRVPIRLTPGREPSAQPTLGFRMP